MSHRPSVRRPTCQHASSLNYRTLLHQRSLRHADLRVPEVRIHTYSRCPTTPANACKGQSLCTRANAEIRYFGKPENFKPSHLSRKRNGGAERDRTDDLMLAKHALSQLSYSPEFCSGVAERKAPSRMDRGDRPKEWWAREDLNFRPHAYQARALTN